MVEYVKKILTHQFEAALCMIDQCIRAVHRTIGKARSPRARSVRVAYHTLFWVDFYLSPGDEDTFVLRRFSSATVATSATRRGQQPGPEQGRNPRLHRNLPPEDARNPGRGDGGVGF